MTGDSTPSVCYFLFVTRLKDRDAVVASTDAASTNDSGHLSMLANNSSIEVERFPSWQGISLAVKCQDPGGKVIDVFKIPFFEYRHGRRVHGLM